MKTQANPARLSGTSIVPVGDTRVNEDYGRKKRGGSGEGCNVTAGEAAKFPDDRGGVEPGGVVSDAEAGGSALRRRWEFV